MRSDTNKEIQKNPSWYEFLLEPSRLQQHLESNGPDSSPTQLIALFFRNIPLNIEVPKTVSNPPTVNGTSSASNVSATTSDENGKQQQNSLSPSPPTLPVVESAVDKLLSEVGSEIAEVSIPSDSYEAKYRTRKAYGLQIMAVKVASYLKWNLDTICSNLTIPIQYKLMQALSNACSSNLCPPEMKKFASILYCNWFLRSAMSFHLSSLQPQSNNTTIIYSSQLQQQQQAADTSALSSMSEVFASTSKQLLSCISELHDYISSFSQTKDDVTNMASNQAANVELLNKAKLVRPLLGCFNSIEEDSNDWTQSEQIDSKEFIETACYDLGRYFFFEENYELAKECFELISESSDKFAQLGEYLSTTQQLLSDDPMSPIDEGESLLSKKRQTEKYLFDCMTEFSKNQRKALEQMKPKVGAPVSEQNDLDLRFVIPTSQQHLSNISTTTAAAIAKTTSSMMADGTMNPNHAPTLPMIRQLVGDVRQQQHITEASRGDMFMAQGNFKQAMSCFVGTVMLMTDYFRIFSKNYIEEEAYISRMIQCSISLSCFTQAVALCQMSRTLNYTIAFKQLNERVCNDCCDDIYECIWNITLLEYIINLHSKRGEIERRTRVVQLMGQLELNENNPEDILKEAEHIRRGKFFRILANRYL